MKKAHRATKSIGKGREPSEKSDDWPPRRNPDPRKAERALKEALEAVFAPMAEADWNEAVAYRDALAADETRRGSLIEGLTPEASRVFWEIADERKRREPAPRKRGEHAGYWAYWWPVMAHLTKNGCTVRDASTRVAGVHNDAENDPADEIARQFRRASSVEAKDVRLIVGHIERGREASANKAYAAAIKREKGTKR